MKYATRTLLFQGQNLPFFQENKRPQKILLIILFLNFALGSCEAKGSTEFSRAETAEKLKQGEIGFILGMDISKVNELSKIDPSAPFYAGLLVESAGDKLRSARLYEAALDSSVPKVKSEAIRKLIPLLTESRDNEQAGRILVYCNKAKTDLAEFVTLKGAALYVLGRYEEIPSLFDTMLSARQGKSGRTGNPGSRETGVASGKALEEFDSWNRALRFLAVIKQQKPGLITHPELRPFLLDSLVNDAYRWAYNELITSAGTLPGTEKTAAAGRLATNSRAYSEALLHYNSVLKSQLSLFFNHTDLLSDLGRTYIVSSRETGYKLFIDWESAIRTGKNSPINTGHLNEAEIKNIRYNLLFYAGRIRRQQGKHGEARELFTRALPLAPDVVQEDACIWYILSSAFTEKPETVPALIKTYASRWNEDDNYYDILDKLSCYLAGQKKWNDMADVFTSIRNGKDGSIIARYAYLVGRAVSLGYIPAGNTKASDYFTIAYEEGNASFYYRALAASYLGRTVIPLSSAASRKNQTQNGGKPGYPHRAEMEFYSHFFQFGASSYAMPFVRENASRYTDPEMRILAKIFAASERYLESIQITGIYMRRENYVMEKADLELYYPKPFTSLIERHAKNNGLHPSVYFGLIRTESAFTPAIASHAGAVGLAQIMPATAKEVAAVIKRRGGPDYAAEGSIDLTNPEINVHMGAVYLKDLTNSLGSPMMALLAYNAGPGRVTRFRRAVPSLPEDLFIETITIAETRNYGKRVMAAAAAYGYLYYNMSMHDVVSSIFK